MESHDLGFVGIDLESGFFTPFLANIEHGLEFCGVCGDEGEVIDVENAAYPDRGRGAMRNRSVGEAALEL